MTGHSFAGAKLQNLEEMEILAGEFTFAHSLSGLASHNIL